MIEEHSLFDRFAANSVRCLNEVSSQGELADKRPCLLYTSDAADEEDSVDLGGSRNSEKKKKRNVLRKIGYITIKAGSADKNTRE